MMQMDTKNFNQAIPDFEHCINKKFKLAPCYYYKSLIAFYQHDYELVIENIDKAIAYDSTNV